MATMTDMSSTTMCAMGMAPGQFIVLPANKVMATMPTANIMDNKPIVNIAPFAMCTSPANPEVASATAAALGVLTPMPCVPNPPGPWIQASSPTEMIGNMPSADISCQLMCAYAGAITFVSPGQMKAMIK